MLWAFIMQKFMKGNVNMKVCIVCKKSFEPNSSVHKLCSDQCIKKWNEIYYKNKYQSFQHACVECGKEFKGTKNAKWCCDECKKQYQHKQKLIRAQQRRDLEKYKYDGECSYCKKQFKGRKNQKFCSENCRCESQKKFNREKAIGLFNEGKNLNEIARELNVSQTTIKRVLRQYGIDTSKNYININKKIAEENFVRRLASVTKLFEYSGGYSGMRKTAIIRCVGCGYEFAKNPNSILCYKEIIVCPCCGAYDHEIDKSIQLKALIERDNNICHICGGTCDNEDVYMNENGKKICGSKYPTIDHVIPRSKGGRHMWSNVKLAHKKCNVVKGNRV